MGRGGLVAVVAIAIVLVLAIFGFVKGFGTLGFSVGSLSSIQQDLQAARQDLLKAQLEVQQKTTQNNQLQEQLKQAQDKGGGSPPPNPVAGSSRLPPPAATATLADLTKRLTEFSDGWRLVASRGLARADFGALSKAGKVRYEDKEPSFGPARDFDLKDPKRQGLIELLGSCVPLGADATPTRPDVLLTYTVDAKPQSVAIVGNFAYFVGRAYFGLDLVQQVRTQIAGW